MKEVLIILTDPPYGTASTIEAYRAILGLVATDVFPKLLATGDGIFNLVEHQKPEALELTSVEGLCKELLEMEIDFYVIKDDWLDRGAPSLIEGIKFISSQEAKEFLSEAELLIRF
jgi:sulfur relay (sulfurtransferase) DsrF/TusC family protein